MNDIPTEGRRSDRRRGRKRSKKAAVGITAGAVAIVLAGYAVVDAYDVVPGLPGILTTDPAIEVQALPSPTTAGKDVPAPASAVDDTAPVPTKIPDEVKRILSDAKVKDFGIEVRDGLSDDVLYSKDQNDPRTPASVTKVFTASAALLSIGGQKRLSTMTEFDPSTSTVTLTGGGDSLLGAGESQPGAVNGHAGLKTLAQETAQSLKSKDIAEVALKLDMSRYSGEDFSSGWDRADIAKGEITPIQPLMIDTGYVGSKDKEWRGRSEHPGKDAFSTFAKELKAAGITVTDAPPGPAGDSGNSGESGESGDSLASVESATISEIVEYALVHSDNVVAEVLGNEVAIAEGQPGSLENGPKAVLSALSDSLDIGQTKLVDTSGLSYDNQISPHDLTTVLQASVVADDSLSSLISYFPVGGLTGTLTDRFTQDGNATGTVHAKTGTLSTVTSLAGGVLDADGRYLVFALQIDDVDKDKILEARKTVDDIVTALAGCGCR